MLLFCIWHSRPTTYSFIVFCSFSWVYSNLYYCSLSASLAVLFLSFDPSLSVYSLPWTVFSLSWFKYHFMKICITFISKPNHAPSSKLICLPICWTPPPGFYRNLKVNKLNLLFFPPTKWFLISFESTICHLKTSMITVFIISLSQYLVSCLNL